MYSWAMMVRGLDRAHLGHEDEALNDFERVLPHLYDLRYFSLYLDYVRDTLSHIITVSSSSSVVRTQAEASESTITSSSLFRQARCSGCC